jgi:ribosomal protein S18 acetylase RimI-like enzyme
MLATEILKKEPQIIRKTVPDDSVQLIKICERSFPLSLRWQAKRWLARQWWKATLLSEACETWGVEEGDKVTAFCVLVNDEPMWAKEKEMRSSSIAICLISALCHPITAIYQVGTCLIASFRKPRSVVIHKELPGWWFHKERLWIELIAVYPDRRGRGLAGILLNHSFLRTKELGRRAIALRVASGNSSAKRLYEKHGFVCYQIDAKGELYLKLLES